jgi:protein-tyrosine-phosphatase
MIIHFVCRGNAFRSVIAEAYLNSLRLKGVKVMSSGTIAATYKNDNEPKFRKTLGLLRQHGIDGFAKSHYADQLTQERLDKADVVVFMNKIALDEGRQLCDLPKHTLVWDVTDLGEKGRIATSEEERQTYAEDAYVEIVRNVDALVGELHLGVE